MTEHEVTMTPEFEASLLAARNRPRYDRALEVRQLMIENAIGIGDLDLLDALESVEGEGNLTTTVPLAYEAIIREVPGEYQWHGNQDDLWNVLTEEVERELEKHGMLVDEDEDDFGSDGEDEDGEKG